MNSSLIYVNYENKTKRKYAGKLSLKPLQFEEAVPALLKVKPMPKEKKKEILAHNP